MPEPEAIFYEYAPTSIRERIINAAMNSHIAIAIPTDRDEGSGNT
jgi:hypothetical protein